MKNKKKMTVDEAGAKGGNTTKRLYGKYHFKKIALKQQADKRARLLDPVDIAVDSDNY